MPAGRGRSGTDDEDSRRTEPPRRRIRQTLRRANVLALQSGVPEGENVRLRKRLAHLLEFCSSGRMVRISSSGFATGRTKMAAFPSGIGRM